MTNLLYNDEELEVLAVKTYMWMQGVENAQEFQMMLGKSLSEGWTALKDWEQEIYRRTAENMINQVVKSLQGTGSN